MSCRKETIVGIQPELMAIFHGPRQQSATELPSVCGKHRTVEEKPNVGRFLTENAR